MGKILWVAPNLNHYKARFLNRLSETSDLDIVVLAGGQMGEDGHKQDTRRKAYAQINLKTTKKKISYNFNVYAKIIKLLITGRFDAVLMPLEKKHLPIIIFLFMLKFLFRFMLVSYNHPTVKFKRRNERYEKSFSKFLFRLYDKIIFYTEQGQKWAVEKNLLPPQKAFFANNTLDTESICNNYSFSVNISAQKTLLFIGRLIPSKRLDLCLQYFKEIKKILPDTKLIIIGDGPDRPLALAESKRNKVID